MPTSEIEEAIVIDAPPEKVWSVLHAFEDYHQWNPLIRRLKGPIEVGSKLRVHLAPFPGTFWFPVKTLVTAYEPGTELRWTGRLLASWLFGGEHSFLLRSNGDHQTEFVQHEKYRGILRRPILFVLGRYFQRGFREMNQALRNRIHVRGTG